MAAARAQRMRRRDPVDDRRETGAAQSAMPISRAGLRIEATLRKSPQVKVASDGSVARCAGEQEVEPILAVKGGRWPRDSVSGCVRLQPGELRSLLTGVESRAGAPVECGIALAASRFLRRDRRRGNRATAAPAPTGRPSSSMSQVPSPCPVTAIAASAPGDIRHGRRQPAQRGDRVGPGPRHVLLDAAAAAMSCMSWASEKSPSCRPSRVNATDLISDVPASMPMMTSRCGELCMVSLPPHGECRCRLGPEDMEVTRLAARTG